MISGTTWKGWPARTPWATWRDCKWPQSSDSNFLSQALHHFTERYFIINKSITRLRTMVKLIPFNLSKIYLKYINRPMFVSKHLNKYTWGRGCYLIFLIFNNSTLGISWWKRTRCLLDTSTRLSALTLSHKSLLQICSMLPFHPSTL